MGPVSPALALSLASLAARLADTRCQGNPVPVGVSLVPLPFHSCLEVAGGLSSLWVFPSVERVEVRASKALPGCGMVDLGRMAGPEGVYTKGDMTLLSPPRRAWLRPEAEHMISSLLVGILGLPTRHIHPPLLIAWPAPAPFPTPSFPPFPPWHLPRLVLVQQTGGLWGHPGGFVTEPATVTALGSRIEQRLPEQGRRSLRSSVNLSTFLSLTGPQFSYLSNELK